MKFQAVPELQGSPPRPAFEGAVEGTAFREAQLEGDVPDGERRGAEALGGPLATNLIKQGREVSLPFGEPSPQGAFAHAQPAGDVPCSCQSLSQAFGHGSPNLLDEPIFFGETFDDERVGHGLGFPSENR